MKHHIDSDFLKVGIMCQVKQITRFCRKVSLLIKGGGQKECHRDTPESSYDNSSSDNDGPRDCKKD
jgi:hypothetical protein